MIFDYKKNRLTFNVFRISVHCSIEQSTIAWACSLIFLCQQSSVWYTESPYNGIIKLRRKNIDEIHFRGPVEKNTIHMFSKYFLRDYFSFKGNTMRRCLFYSFNGSKFPMTGYRLFQHSTELEPPTL